jgi:hypothetical protein
MPGDETSQFSGVKSINILLSSKPRNSLDCLAYAEWGKATHLDVAA